MYGLGPLVVLARYAAALLAVAAVTVFIGLVLGSTQIANISMLYLTAVLASATFLGRGPAILAALASFLSFNWFFVEPVHQVTVAAANDLVSLVLFLLVAVVTGQLAADQRARAREARQREREARVLYDVVRLLAERPLEEGLRGVGERLRRELAVEGVAIETAGLGQPEERIVVGTPAASEQLRDRAPVAHRVLGGGQAPRDDVPASPGRWVKVVPPGVRVRDADVGLHAVPLVASGERRGALLLLRRPGTGSFSTGEDRLISAVGQHLALALERASLRHRATEGEVLRRADEAKSALLHAVSHDLRTPLSSIIAAATSLRQRDVSWSDEEREEFVAGIEAEARRLDRLVTNLLNVSRIDSGVLRPVKEWHDVGALVEDVVARLRSREPRHRIVVEGGEGLPPVQLDYVAIEQTMVNLIENAMKFSPPETDVTVTVRQADGAVRVAVADRGPGVPAAAFGRIFEPFERADGDAAGGGSGLGLAVAKRFVEAHGGRIWAEPREGGGSTFAFELPVSR